MLQDNDNDFRIVKNKNNRRNKSYLIGRKVGGDQDVAVDVLGEKLIK